MLRDYTDRHYPAMVTSRSVCFVRLESIYGRDLYYKLATWLEATVGILTTGQIVGHAQALRKTDKTPGSPKHYWRALFSD
jgi:hypothetical protein